MTNGEYLMEKIKYLEQQNLLMTDRVRKLETQLKEHMKVSSYCPHTEV